MKITRKNNNYMFWIPVVFFLILPIILERYLPIHFFSSYWFLSLPSIFIVLFRFGTKSGITILCVSSLIHIFWEVFEFIRTGELISKEEFEMIAIVNLVKVSVTVLTAVYLIKINQQKKELQILNDRLEKLAHMDHLTGLPNRLMLQDYINKEITESEKYNQKFSVMFLDLDRFKEINDTLGHAAGDSLLIQVAERLQRSVRKNDVVFRLAGDEFVIVLKDITKEECRNVADRIISEMSDSFILEGMESSISPSIGISFYPENGGNYQEILKNADKAMYLAKLKGKNNFQFV
ncbi:GGDEF domain-containing protein [Bacillus sp. B1-b2]|uniref:GGDEF domain-containing protein n=1 Tax=Bacillus sp. B1-b2 TaxID=2653201 RepID=UPI001262AA83|nr:GGDEF domain-containing protein [Bacillus sp. B1-b2]KAB7668916.1 GGDEF domain-containing protein [Bacillus sp. B1-b2]